MKGILVLSRWSGVVLASMFAMAATVSSFASGCGGGNDRYYCDGNGCYSCDGYGCSNVTPPAPQSCNGNAGCASGSVCTSLGCQASCKVDTDCQRGNVCISGLCGAPGTDAGTPKECTTKADCTGTSQVCIANKCETCGGTSGPCPCTASTDCTNGDQCAGGVCTPAVDLCKYSSECATGESCANGQCVKTCTQASDCGAGKTCTKGVCQTDPSQAQCTSDASCSGATPKCVGGSCVASCTVDTDCSSGNYCNQGACVPDTRPQPTCGQTGLAACAANQQCVDGFCRYDCTTDNDCKLIDARIGYCGTDHVCRTLAEAHPQCTGATGCAAGQICVDNVCK